MRNYLKVMQNVLENGDVREDRTGVGTISTFGVQMFWDLEKGFPAVTTKTLAFKSVIGELLWFMSGSQDRRELQRFTKGNFNPDSFDIWRGNCLDQAKKQPNRFNGFNVGNMYSIAWRRKPVHPYQDPSLMINRRPVTESVYAAYDGKTPLNAQGLSPLKAHHRLYNIWEEMIHGRIPFAERWATFETFRDDAYCLWGYQEFVDSFSTGEAYKLSLVPTNGDILAPDTAVFIPTLMESRENVYWVDQLQNVIDQLLTNPNSRRIVMDSWNTQDTHNAVLGACHPLVQFYVQGGRLSCQFYQRSSDLFLGAPFNIASYAAMVHILARMTGLKVGVLNMTIGDAHIYLNHVDQVKEQLTRKPLTLPKFVMPKFDTLEELLTYTAKDFILEGYSPHPAIKADMAV